MNPPEPQSTPVDRWAVRELVVIALSAFAVFVLSNLFNAPARLEAWVGSLPVGSPLQVTDDLFLVLAELGVALGVFAWRRMRELRRAEANLHAANTRLETLSRQLVEARERERQSLALELQDELSQVLHAAKLSLDQIESVPRPEAHEQFQRAQNLVGDVIQKIRELALDLRPTVLDDLGLARALTSLCRLHTERTGIETQLLTDLAPGRRFPPAIEIAAYRMVQEGLANAARHAGADYIDVTLRADERQLTVAVIDTGSGFAPEKVWEVPGITGLSFLREQARLLGGDVVVESSPGTGTRLIARLPVAGSGAPASHAPANTATAPES